MAASVVRCVDIHKEFFYRGGELKSVHVLKGISAEFREGELVSIVGASGAGKSTFLHILGGLDHPTRGTVYWDTTEIFRLDDHALSKIRARTVGFVFQFHHLLPEFTALENVAMPALIVRQPKEWAFRRAKELLNKIGLADRAHHKPSELSGGEQQRVAVARALMNNPRIVFADEPSGNLDSANAKQLYELIVTLNRSEGKTFVIVTHNDRFAAYAQRVLRMVDGVLEEV
jgi:lipoprotein-releasing system ATP-binding protein